MGPLPWPRERIDKQLAINKKAKGTLCRLWHRFMNWIPGESGNNILTMLATFDSVACLNL
jgi:hypothetical protein